MMTNEHQQPFEQPHEAEPSVEGYAAAQMPSSDVPNTPVDKTPDTTGTPEPNHDGATAPIEPSPLIEPYPHTSTFWQLPLEPNVFYESPLLVHQQLADAERVVLQMESYLLHAGYSAEASDLRLRYTQWVKTPAREYEQLRHELEPKREAYTQQLEQIERALAEAQTAFMQAMARAKIPLPLPEEKKRRHKKPQPPEPIRPALVEKALKADFASDDEVCGEQGIAPVSTRGNIWTMVGRWLFEFGAPLFAGLLLGVNLGVIVGLLSWETLQRAEALWLVVLAAIIGLFVEKLVGETAYAVAASTAMASEKRNTLPNTEPFPHMYSLLRVGIFIIAVVVLTAAVALVDAIGLYTLYKERMQEAQLTGAAATEEFAFWVFLLVGLIVSAPYIVNKAVKGWREPEIRQREARIAYLHWKHVERRRQEPEVQEAFVRAQEVQNLHDMREQLLHTLDDIKARLDSARINCIGNTQRFVEYWHALVEHIKREQAPYAPRNGLLRARTNHSTLLNRLLEAFRRR